LRRADSGEREESRHHHNGKRDERPDIHGLLAMNALTNAGHVTGNGAESEVGRTAIQYHFLGSNLDSIFDARESRKICPASLRGQAAMTTVDRGS
jgi:hypothetical protein